MGIDTKDRRKSVVNWFLRLLPSPDTVIDIADRAQIGGLYRGVFASLNARLVTSDLLIKKLNIFINTTSDLLISKSNNIVDITVDSLIKKLSIIKSVTSDLTILLKGFKATTADIILSLSQIATGDRRKSVTNSISRILPFPDGVIDRSDRRHVAGFYRHVAYTVYDIGISVDSLIKKINIDKYITSDLLVKKLDNILSITVDSLIRRSDDVIFTISDLLVKKLDIITSFTSDVLLWLRISVPILCDVLIKKLNIVKSVTADIVIIVNPGKEYINLKSYINVSEDAESVITTNVNDDSDILMSISKFSETDSDISIIRYSIVKFIR